MLHPSYTDLMKVVNQDVEEGETKVVNSRYSIVLATSKRARQLIDGDIPLVHVKNGEKPLSIAIDELNKGRLTIIAENADEDQDENVQDGLQDAAEEEVQMSEASTDAPEETAEDAQAE